MMPLTKFEANHLKYAYYLTVFLFLNSEARIPNYFKLKTKLTYQLLLINNPETIFDKSFDSNFFISVLKNDLFAKGVEKTFRSKVRNLTEVSKKLFVADQQKYSLLLKNRFATSKAALI